MLTQEIKGAESFDLQPKDGPAFENGWQGGVANTIVTARSRLKSSIVILVTSCGKQSASRMAA